MTNTEHTIDCIQLINSEGIGPVTFHKFVSKYGTPSKALKALPQYPKYTVFPRSHAQKELEKATKQNIHILTYDSPEYPQKLKKISGSPPILYVSGNKDILNHNLCLSIVGARNASILGRKTASQIAYDLTNKNVLIISGMARGIDAAAHKGAMYALEQKGPTIAVLGTGVDIPYPSENNTLYEQIKEQGAIISEFPLGTPPQANNFPRRNRIVSGLSNGTLVVEATTNSGSLITSDFAKDQGLHIFAIPGSPQDARALGPNKLIKEGAVLVESAQDIYNILKTPNTKKLKTKVDNKPSNVAIGEKQTSLMFESPQQQKATDLLNILTPTGIHMDELVRETGLDSATLSFKLLELELTGQIERQPGNIVALIRKKK